MDGERSYEYSAGVVVFKRTRRGLRYLVIRSCAGAYGFPKGHIEAGESEREAAVRELYEETGIKARLVDGFVRRDEYPLPFLKNTSKKVVYFLGEYESGTPTPQEKETSGVYFLDYREAQRRLYFPNLKSMLGEARAFIRRNCNV